MYPSAAAEARAYTGAPMISLIQLPHRSAEDPQKRIKRRELAAGLTLTAILLLQVGLIAWALLKDWHLR